MIDESNGREPYFPLLQPTSSIFYFFAATLLPEVAFAQLARPGNFCLASNWSFADIGFSNVIYLFPRLPVPRVFLPFPSHSETCIKRCRCFIIIRVRRPVRRRPISLNSDGRKTKNRSILLFFYLLSFKAIEILMS